VTSDPVDTVQPAQPPGAKQRALEHEQAHLDRVHERVEDLRARAAARLAAASADRSGSTFQARFERDVTAHHHAARSARYTFGDVESLAFGRLDLADGDTFHVGRVSVIDADGDAILVDWRAPAAAAFYQATPATPLHVARRRTLVTHGRTVRDLDDELLDAEAAEALGLDAVTGQGALLAALSKERTGQMRDIVATIQGDQDRIIRAPASGTLVVTGGPGTGKTVVALHRVAYLLYRDRERFEGRGVLVIGPSAAFTEYTARVLPALGEDRAVQRPLARLAPRGVEVHGWDDLDVASTKGDLAMVEVLHRLVAASLPPIPPETRVSFQGTTAIVRGSAIARVRDEQLRRVRPDRDGAAYHDRTDAAEQALRAELWRAWRRTHRQAGGSAPDSRDETGFDASLDASAASTMLRRCYWPERTPEEVLRVAATREVDLGELAGDLLDQVATDRLHAAWARTGHWTVDDAALLDELAACLGTPPSRRPAPARPREDGGMRLSSEDLHLEVERVDVEADDYRDFAHVVVDEAQDLTPMQWRAVARRGPYASWTVVGDLAQRSRVAEPSTWEAVASLLGRRDVAITSLSINYRTPREVAEVARAVLELAGHDPASAPDAIRSTGEQPVLWRTDDAADTVERVVDELLRSRDGTVAVLAHDTEVAALAALVLDDLDAVDASRVQVLDPRTAKGLEFDDVVVVGPARIAAASDVGLHQLYVAVTRATRTLHVVAGTDEVVPAADRFDTRVEPPAS
jgi:DNA helicase IV